MARLMGLLCFLLTADFLAANVLPLTGKELSLMLRSGYSSESVLRELAARKFADTFDLTLEQELLKAGATQSVVEALRSGNYQASARDMAIVQEHTKSAQAPKAGDSTPTSSLRREEQQGSRCTII